MKKVIHKYVFKARNLPVVTKELVDSWELEKGKIYTTLTLGKNYESIYKNDDEVIIRGFKYKFKELKKIKGGYVYALDNGTFYPISYFSGKFYYKLYPIASDKPPTLEISGIRMHRVVGIDPWTDSRRKIKVLNIRKDDKVLDICTGLGYTAINAFYISKHITSIELDENVLNIASYNPWSKDLENIEIILGDAYEVTQYLEEESFDAIIHDPPRLSRAGLLYSFNFYRQLFRILKPCGRLFHYTGKVGYKHRKLHILGGVASRLKKAGFKTFTRRDLDGILAFKPCR